MRLRSIARKLLYVLVGALGTYVVERVPAAPSPRSSDMQGPAPEEPARAPVIHDGTNVARVDVDQRKLVAAFEGSRSPEPVVRCADDGFDVVQLGPNYRAVHRAFVDCMLAEQSQLMGHTRMVPVMRDGRTSGVKLYGVHSGDTLWKLGFRNGDELRDVNEMDVTDPSHALEAYASLRNNPRLSAGVVRDGEPLRLWFLIC